MRIMAHPLRIEYAGPFIIRRQIYGETSSAAAAEAMTGQLSWLEGNRGQGIFDDDADRRKLVGDLARGMAADFHSWSMLRPNFTGWLCTLDGRLSDRTFHSKESA